MTADEADLSAIRMLDVAAEAGTGAADAVRAS